MQIPLNLIQPNPKQPRRRFDQTALNELAQSIKEHGVLQPIVVELLEGGDDELYIIHYGERRWRAAQLAGLAEIPCVVTADQVGDEASYLARAMIENVQRENLNPLEVAQGYQRLHDLGWSDQQIAESVGKSRSTVANARRLLTLPEAVREPLANGQISERQAQAIAPVFQLPETASQIVEARSHIKPANLIEMAINGTSSESLRDEAKWVIRRGTEKIDFLFTTTPLDGDYRSPTCSDCSAQIRLDKEQRCPDKGCADGKRAAWRLLQLERATEASGIPPYEPGANEHSWEDVERLAPDIGQRILAQGCDKLRLGYQMWADGRNPLKGHPHVYLICHHGQGNKCTCLAAIKREWRKNDPDHHKEQEAKKRLEQLVIAPAIGVIVAAWEKGEVESIAALRLLLPGVCHVQIDQASDWDTDKLLNRLARSLVSSLTPWRSQDNIPGALAQLQQHFKLVGLSWPEIGPLAGALDRIEKKLARVEGWLQTTDAPTLKAIQGNIDNINALVNELDDLDEANSLTVEQKARYEALLQRAAQILEALMQAVGVQTVKGFYNG